MDWVNKNWLSSVASEQRERGQRLLTQPLVRCNSAPRKFVDVADWRWWLFTFGIHQHSFVSALYQIIKTLDFYDVSDTVLVSLLITWRWRIVIQIYLSIPYIAFIAAKWLKGTGLLYEINWLELIVTRSSAIAEGPRDASCQLKSCQLPRNIAETTYTTSPDQIDGMK